jgi:hypothetical protein
MIRASSFSAALASAWLASAFLATPSPTIASPSASDDTTIAGHTRPGIPIGVSVVSELGVMSDNLAASRWATGLSIGPDAPLHAEVLLRAQRPFGGSPSTQLRGDVRLVLGPATRGVWLGIGQEPAWSQEVGAEGTVLGLGGWTVHDRLTISASVEQARIVRTSWYQSTPPESLASPVFTSSTRSAPATAAQVSVRWTAARLTFETAGGFTASMQSAPYRWGQAVVSMPVSRQFALFATAGSRAPRWFALDPGGGHRATFGLRFTDAVGPVVETIGRVHETQPSLRWHLEKHKDGWRTLVVIAHRARMVEVMGDMTDWSPLALTPLGGDRWEIELPLDVGVHEIELRLDGGAWMPPPGAPTRMDGFNGEVGQIVIE